MQIPPESSCIYSFVSGKFWVGVQLGNLTENERLTLIRILRESNIDGRFQHYGACQTLVLTEMILWILLSLNGVVTGNPHLAGVSFARLNELDACS